MNWYYIIGHFCFHTIFLSKRLLSYNNPVKQARLASLTVSCCWRNCLVKGLAQSVWAVHSKLVVQETSDFFIKGLAVNILSHLVLATTRNESSHRQFVKKWPRLCSIKLYSQSRGQVWPVSYSLLIPRW